MSATRATALPCGWGVVTCRNWQLLHSVTMRHARGSVTRWTWQLQHSVTIQRVSGSVARRSWQLLHSVATQHACGPVTRKTWLVLLSETVRHVYGSVKRRVMPALRDHPTRLWVCHAQDLAVLLSVTTHHATRRPWPHWDVGRMTSVQKQATLVGQMTSL